MSEHNLPNEIAVLRRMRRLFHRSTTQHESDRYLRGDLKRTMDQIIGSLGVITFSPVIAGEALINKIIDPFEPAFYATERVGQSGAPIRMTRIRSLKSVAGEAGEVPPAFLPDGRKNRYGNLLRRTGLDHCPELMNLAKGELSLVGSRAIPQYEIDEHIKPQLLPQVFERWLKDYLSYRPGGTGLVVVLGIKEPSYQQRARLDRFYATHASFGFDLYIIGASIARFLKERRIH